MHLGENLVAYLMLLLWLIKANLLLAMPYERSACHLLDYRSREPCTTSWPNINTLTHHTHKHTDIQAPCALPPLGKDLSSFLPSFPWPSRPAQLNQLSSHQAPGSLVTEAAGGDRAVRSFLQTRSGETRLGLIQFNLYSISFWFYGAFTFMARKKHFCQNAHHSIRPAEEVLNDALPCEGTNKEGCDITPVYPLATGTPSVRQKWSCCFH